MNKQHHHKYRIDTHEILIDSNNLPGLNESSARLEHPVRFSSLRIVIFLMLLVFAAFSLKLFDLQIANGADYRKQSESNRLRHSVIIAERGVIYDRNGTRLVWNEKAENRDDHPKRKYIDVGGFGHILGHTKPPAKDRNGFYYRTYFSGVSGAEAIFDEDLQGENGTRIIETNVGQEVVSKSLIKEPRAGGEIRLSIDAEINNKLYEEIKEASEEYGFRGGAAVIMDIHTAEVIALTSFPEPNPNVLFSGEDKETINGYINDPANPYLNRTLDGVFTPGSIVKPFVAAAALNEELIDPNKTIFSDGALTIRNPYNPSVVYTFRDWQPQGTIDMRKALAVSSNEYFYIIGGGYEDQKGLGIDNIYKYMHMFGFGEKTGIALGGESVGVVPNREWKKSNFEDEEWYLGDTYHTSIGQYGFLVTPIQAVRATAAIANGGTMLTPRISSEIPLEKKELDLEDGDLEVVRQGMRLSVTDKIARSLKFSELSIAAKTGTAEVGSDKGFENSWVVGYFPYEEPKYAFAILLDHVDESNSFGAAPNMRSFFQWLIEEKPEYIGSEVDN